MNNLNREKREEKIKNYIEKLFPTKLRNGKEINLERFSMFFGNLARNNPMLLDVATDCETHNFNTLEDIKKQTSTSKKVIHLAEGMDQYYTPNLFAGTKDEVHRNEKSVMWLNALYVDIDGIKDVYDYREGLFKLYKACQKAEIPLPDLVVKTSSQPTIHLQALWLIDPIYIKDRFNPEKNKKNIDWWESANRSLSYVLGQADSDFKMDTAVSSDKARYLRLPYTRHMKTGEYTELIADRVTEKRHLLQDNWVKNMMKEYFTRDYTFESKYTDIDEIEILEHPQYKAILQGVPKDYRNFAHYAIIKACEVTGYSYDETLEKLIEFNTRCKPQEKLSQIRSTMSAYNDGKGIDIGRIAEVATISFGEGEFNPDLSLLRLFNVMKGTLRGSSKKKNNSYKKEIKSIVIPLLKSYIKTGVKHLPNVKELAESLNINYNTLKKEFSNIKAELQKYNLFINYDYSKKKYKILSYAELLEYAFERKYLEENQPKNTQKVIHRGEYILPYIVLSLYCQRSCSLSLFTNYLLCFNKRGSPFVA
jgi:hypothetical protein